jgi:hypothetical protein
MSGESHGSDNIDTHSSVLNRFWRVFSEFCPSSLVNFLRFRSSLPQNLGNPSGEREENHKVVPTAYFVCY